MFSHNSSFLIKQRYLKYKPLQKQLLVCNRSCKQNLAFKKAINISKPNDVTEIKAAADNCNEEIHMVEPVNDLVG